MNIEKQFRRVVTRAGLDPKEVVRHTLRHTAITHLVQAGVDLSTMQRISGHKTLQMVVRYSHQNGEHIILIHKISVSKHSYLISVIFYLLLIDCEYYLTMRLIFVNLAKHLHLFLDNVVDRSEYCLHYCSD